MQIPRMAKGCFILPLSLFYLLKNNVMAKSKEFFLDIEVESS